MAKRFTETGKWKKKWIRELGPEMKLFWFYLLDNCDHAGIWEVDIELAAFQIGIELDESEILNTFNRKIVPFKPGKWFVPKFIVYQYGELNESNRAHNSVIKILTKYKLYKGLTRGLQGHMDMDKELDMDKDKDKGSKKEQLETIKSNR
jgi:type IV secretory pathway VirB6-like protein